MYECPVNVRHNYLCQIRLCVSGLGAIEEEMGCSEAVYVSVISLVVAGVAQVLNRLDGKPFDDADQRLFEVCPPFIQTFLCKLKGGELFMCCDAKHISLLAPGIS